MPTNKELEQQVRDLKKQVATLENKNRNLVAVLSRAIMMLGRNMTQGHVQQYLQDIVLKNDGFEPIPAEQAMRLVESEHEIIAVNLDYQRIDNFNRRNRGVIHIHEGGKPRYIGKDDTVYVKVTKYPEPVSAQQDAVVDDGESTGG